jgi:hypothetical protein
LAESKRVFIHIGAPKTGTTYLQQVLDRNRLAMEGAGVLYPRVGGTYHHSAVWDLRGTFENAERGRGFAGNWAELVRQSVEWRGHAVVISSEMLVYSPPKECVEILESFGDAEMHVIYTARDLVRQVPAVWQEQVKNRRVMEYGAYLADVLGRRSTNFAQHFWGAQDAATALERWSQGLQPHQVHVVTAPPPGSPADLLWQRFAGVIGLDPGHYPSEIAAANESLSVTSAEVLRRYNERYGGKIPILKYRSDVMSQLLPALTEAVADRSKLPLTKDQRKKIVELSQGIVDRLDKAGYDIVGSLDELVPARPGLLELKGPGRGPDELSDGEIVDALIDVLHHVMRSAVQQRSATK